MKKIYLSLVAAIAGLSLQAQLTQANHAPVPNYSFQLLHCDSSSAITPGASGTNAVWNFSTIATYSNLVNTYNTASVTGNPTYTNADVVVFSGSSTNSYYKSSPSALYYYGGNFNVGGTSATLVYTNSPIAMSYPMGPNGSVSSAIAGDATVTVFGTPVTASITGNYSVVADGHGTLLLPGSAGTFTDVLRVVSTQTMAVSAGFASGSFKQVTYEYYASGIRNPVFTIMTATASLPGNTTTQTTVTRDKNAVGSAPTNTVIVTGISELNTASSFNLYPNPSSSVVNFVTDSPDAKHVTVYDITGKQVDRAAFADGKTKVDVSSLNSGLYLYTITGSNNSPLKTGKLTVNH